MMHNLNWSLCSVLSELVFSHSLDGGCWALSNDLTIQERHDLSLDASKVQTKAGGHDKSVER